MATKPGSTIASRQIPITGAAPPKPVIIPAASGGRATPEIAGAIVVIAMVVIEAPPAWRESKGGARLARPANPRRNAAGMGGGAKAH
jgi:hypothetical protein